MFDSQRANRDRHADAVLLSLTAQPRASRPGMRIRVLSDVASILAVSHDRDRPNGRPDAANTKSFLCQCRATQDLVVMWLPSQEGLQQLLTLFKASQSAGNTQHRAIQHQLKEFNAIPDYNSYLAYILNQLKHEDGAVRQLAGLMLKNNIKEHWLILAPEVQQYVRESLLGSVGDPQKYIRATAGSCITTLVCELTRAGGEHPVTCARGVHSPCALAFHFTFSCIWSR